MLDAVSEKPSTYKSDAILLPSSCSAWSRRVGESRYQNIEEWRGAPSSPVALSTRPARTIFMLYFREFVGGSVKGRVDRTVSSHPCGCGRVRLLREPFGGEVNPIAVTVLVALRSEAWKAGARVFLPQPHSDLTCPILVYLNLSSPVFDLLSSACVLYEHVTTRTAFYSTSTTSITGMARQGVRKVLMAMSLRRQRGLDSQHGENTSLPTSEIRLGGSSTPSARRSWERGREQYQEIAQNGYPSFAISYQFHPANLPPAPSAFSAMRQHKYLLEPPDHFLSSSSRCKGSTHISEDSSEIAFLLVENYQLTAPVGLRIGREFLNHTICVSNHFSSVRSSTIKRGRAWRRERHMHDDGDDDDAP